MRTAAAQHSSELEVKKSRFLTTVVPTGSPEEALVLLARIRDDDATHNCWAYKVGAAYRFSDDGEPGGTAGRPILAAIEAQGFDRVLVVVTRHFGGIKLGAGGLARAYGGAAAECLRGVPAQEIRSRSAVEVTVPFDAIGAVYPLIERFCATKLGEEYGESGVVVAIEIDEAAVAEFAQALADATRGQGALSPVKPAGDSTG
jgi:uncharacterized YigZ family protein